MNAVRLHAYPAGPTRSSAVLHHLLAPSKLAEARRVYRWWRQTMGPKAARIATLAELTAVFHGRNVITRVAAIRTELNWAADQ